MNEKWDTADIAGYLEVTRDHVTAKIVRAPDFPPPIINRGPRLRRWLADEVRRWAAGAHSLAAISSDEAR